MVNGETMKRGYSDRINHALAFAAKFHDQQVRRGTRLPYATHAANVAVILTRYDQDDDCVISGILHNVISDYVLDGFSESQIQERLGEKFGDVVVRTVLAIVERREDSDGVEMSQEERKRDLLDRITEAPAPSLWVCAADKLHMGASLLADLRRTGFPEMVWERQPNGRESVLRWYREIHSRMVSASFDAPIVVELGEVIDELEQFRH
jgi:(p)ppGpp synthase/HD superfamily hydrolase